MSTESACGWSVPSLTGNLSIDLSVPRLWRREGLNRHQSSLMLAQIDGVFCLFFSKLGFRPEVCRARRVQMRFYPLHKGLSRLSLGARGNRGLSPLILSIGPSTLR
uniref:Uncharacterized protein n=1 Tax=Brassica campestris TaxID=3711 RepID=M4EX89_BRACM